MEHGVTEATDVQDVVSLRSLRAAVRLQVNADQLGSLDPQLTLILDERLPLGHDARRALRTVTPRAALVDPALRVADQNRARKLALAVLGWQLGKTLQTLPFKTGSVLFSK